jgi:hypothetical protein
MLRGSKPMSPMAATLTLLLSLALSAVCFSGIVRSYRRLSGFPWLHALGFAAAAIAALFALRALLAS